MVAQRHPFLDHPGVIAFAHRGGAADAPENTLPAFERAVSLGYRYLETDVHATSDGEVVVLHDATLDRVTDHSGPVNALPLHVIRQADAGYRFTPDGGRTFPFRGRGIRVPTLSEVLDRFPGCRLNIDPKDDRVAAPLVDVLRRHGAFDRVCIGSFFDQRLARIRARAGQRICTSMGRTAVTIGYLRSRITGARIPRCNADCIQVPARWRAVGLVDQRFVSAAHAAGLPVQVWTVDDVAMMRSLLDIGVDGIMTDRLEALRTLLVERGAWHDAGSARAADAPARLSGRPSSAGSMRR